MENTTTTNLFGSRGGDGHGEKAAGGEASQGRPRLRAAHPGTPNPTTGCKRAPIRACRGQGKLYG